MPKVSRGQAPCGGCPPAGAGTWLVGNTKLANNTNQNAAKHANLKEKSISLYEGAQTAPSPPHPLWLLATNYVHCSPPF